VKSLLAVTHLGCIGIVLLSAICALTAEGPTFPDIIDKIKPAIVAVGSFQKTRRPPSIFRGTGFVIADGLHIVTNAHVVPEKIDIEKKEVAAVFVGKADLVEVREATKVAEDRDHDLAVLRIAGRPITAMTLGDANRVREGEIYAFTGFPIGMVLGLNAVTHRGIISAITPVVIPQLTAKLLEKKIISRLTARYNVFQLDATAYPGSSGSPLYQPETGQVVGIINKVFIQETKETVIQKPSGISYAIPVNHLQELLKKIRLE
jgi:serine protease Do